MMIQESFEYYADEFKKLAENQSPLQALTVLSKNRDEIERACNNKAKKLVTILDDCLKEEFLGKYSQVIYEVLHNMQHTLNTLPQLAGIIDDQMRFNLFMEDYLIEEEKNEKTYKKIYRHVNEYLKMDDRLESIEMLIVHLIENDYSIDESFQKKLENIEKRRENKRLLRQLDSTAPQEKIREKVKELAEIKRFQTEEGNPNPATIKAEIMNCFPELMGEVSEHTLLRRIKKAIDTLELS